MKKTATVLLTAVVASSVLAGCGGDDPYCAAVKENKSALDTFGQKRTNAGFRAYADAVRAITTTAPDSSKDDWAKLGSVTAGVLKAHKKVGLPLQAMDDPAKVDKLGSADLKRLNAAYAAFNETTKQRQAVVKDVKAVCDITLK
jgi:hypothetical protein